MFREIYVNRSKLGRDIKTAKICTRMYFNIYIGVEIRFP